jgi:hypothetical protein
MRRLAAFLVLFSSAATSAQSQGLMVAGERVRITTRADGRFAGRLIANRTDSVVVSTETAAVPRAVARSDIAHVEASGGMRTHKARNATIGAVVGGAVGGVVGAAVGKGTESACNGSGQTAGCLVFTGVSQTSSALVFGTLGAVLGGTVGLLMGRRATEEWVHVDSQSTAVRVGLIPASGRVEMRATLSF